MVSVRSIGRELAHHEMLATDFCRTKRLNMARRRSRLEGTVGGLGGEQRPRGPLEALSATAAASQFQDFLRTHRDALKPVVGHSPSILDAHGSPLREDQFGLAGDDLLLLQHRLESPGQDR